MFKVGDRVKVVTQFNQSGKLIPVGTCFKIVWSGTGNQVACQFEEPLFYGMHTCSGECPDDLGFWVYRYLIDEHCIMAVSETPTWVL
jgi:hypothetical protein